MELVVKISHFHFNVYSHYNCFNSVASENEKETPILSSNVPRFIFNRETLGYEIIWICQNF